MKLIDKILKRNEIKIIRIKTTSSGIAFYVGNGKGLLCEKYGSITKNEGLHTLLYDGVPLVKFHTDEYFCPTCEKLISAGYGLDKCNDSTLSDLSGFLNEPFENLEKSFEIMTPLFGLLSTGYYWLSDIELYPTEGNGTFFWTVSNKPVYNLATCPVYDKESFRWSFSTPKYLLPTQPPILFNRERAEYYRTREDTRAVAYYMDGYFCALLDGHHKAVAAALDGKPVKALVIIPAASVTPADAATDRKGSINFFDGQIFEDELPVEAKTLTIGFSDRRMTEAETEICLKCCEEAFDTFIWPKDILDSAKKFYDVRTLAYMEWAGDLSMDRIKGIIIGRVRADEDELHYIAHALFVTNSPLFLEFCFFIGRNEVYVHIWHNIFGLLAQVKNEQIEDFFIEYLVNQDTKLRPHITRIVDAYFIEND